ncbi:hypothetical protein L596_019321 [Steinernema carpocapsae]|uniref:Ribosomal protein S14 n=1 Tax=Steinernema carpocapsae TaxID=34508 RepID=A0A4U5MQ46_STECR|nr:hypothetical protein L596_019321 [Steinernema carpocapsae]
MLLSTLRRVAGVLEVRSFASRFFCSTTSAAADVPGVRAEDVADEETAAEDPTAVPAVIYSQDRLKTLKLDEYPFYIEREWWKEGKRMTFWSNWRMLRDIRRRQKTQELASERMRLKALKFNTILPQAIRDECAEQLNALHKDSHPKLILNLCQFTGRRRGKIKPYRLVRHEFRRLADHGQLSGVQRAMW